MNTTPITDASLFYIDNHIAVVDVAIARQLEIENASLRQQIEDSRKQEPLGYITNRE